MLLFVFMIQNIMSILTETWLYADIDGAELGLMNYHIFRANRDLLATGKTTEWGAIIVTPHNLMWNEHSTFPCSMITMSFDKYVNKCQFLNSE